MPLDLEERMKLMNGETELARCNKEIICPEFRVTFCKYAKETLKQYEDMCQKFENEGWTIDLKGWKGKDI